ncbi:predicted protein [Arabidopsis lyrata subsp. lyrata]|uniref:Predicted protein n=1 Tax=Arabidopsis lyrata subsp. lyrata TaxID=81972 RepID=D7KIG9_ARALL|nr:predicted protein [Arabidopsis lyrata subsp. lyrata]
MAPTCRQISERSPLVNQQRQITSFFGKYASFSSPSPSPSPPLSNKKTPKSINPNPNSPFPSPSRAAEALVGKNLELDVKSSEGARRSTRLRLQPLRKPKSSPKKKKPVKLHSKMPKKPPTAFFFFLKHTTKHLLYMHFPLASYCLIFLVPKGGFPETISRGESGGNGIPVSPEVANGLKNDEAYGVVLMRVVILGRLRWKAGAIKTGRYGFYARCDVWLRFNPSPNGQVPLLAPSTCKVDV